MTKKLIVSNWKNHPDSLSEAEQILDSVDEYLGSLNEKELSLIFCPPFVFTEEVGKILKTSHLVHQAELGAQDISMDDSAALTGEVSGSMLRKLGAKYVIVGHSERRWKLGESDEVVNKKLKAVLRNEMVPIVCVGERTRDEDFKDFLKEQTLNTFAGLSSDEVARCVVAYEPVWAISRPAADIALGVEPQGPVPILNPDTPKSALESISLIRETLITNYQLPITNKFLYGGSVTSRNAREFLGSEGVDGVLVGGASVNKEEFVKILATVSKIL